MDSILFLTSIVFFLLQSFLVCASQMCDGENGKVCCSGFLWNETMNDCMPCLKGFYGKDCRPPCPPPSFGFGCLSTCICPNERCHHIYGCKNNSLDACESGTFGKYCEHICRFPNYGKGCQLKCNCDTQYCNPSRGCINIESTTTSPEALLSSLALTETSAVSERFPTFSTLKTTNDDVAQGTSNGFLCLKKAQKSRIENASSSLVFSIIGLLIIAALFLVVYICIILYRAHAQSSCYV